MSDLKNIKRVIWNIIIMFAIILVINFLENKFVLKSNFRQLNSFNEKWSISVDGKEIRKLVSLPIELDYKDYDKISITNTLPARELKNPNILIRSNLQSINVYLDDSLYYSFGKSEEQIWGKEPESNWIFIELPQDYANKTIKIEYLSQYEWSRGYINSIRMGNKTDLVLSIIQENGNKFIGSIILFAIGLLLIFIYYGLFQARGAYTKIFYLSVIDILVAIWIAFDSNILELFMNDALPRGEIKIISLYFTLVAVCEFVKSVCTKRYHKLLSWLEMITVIFIISSSLLHFFNILHYVQTIFIFHILYLFMAVTFAYMLVKENMSIIEKHKYLLLPIIIAFSSVIIDIINYYLIQSSTLTHYSGYSVIVFTLVFSYYVGKDFLVIYNDEVKANLYKELAYTDALTKLYNKSAFDEKMAKLNKQVKKSIGMPIFVFNINNLKKLNDTLGHHAGDEYIKENAKILVDIFKDYGDLYRVGADDFVFIGSKETPIAECQEKLSKYVEVPIPEHKIFFAGMAYGYDVVSRNTKSVYDVHLKADKNMCKLKNRLRYSNIR